MSECNLTTLVFNSRAFMNNLKEVIFLGYVFKEVKSH